MFEETVSLASLAPKRISPQELLALCQSDHADGHVYICPTMTAGSANSKIIQALPQDDESCRRAVQHLGRPAPHQWREESLVLCNFPCYLVTKCGTVITQDGKIIAETLYPSAGEKTLERFLDIKVPTGRISDVLSRAGRLDTTKVCSSFFSRWSRVYFHMLSECLVQYHIYERLGIKPWVRLLVTTDLNPVQKKLIDFARPVADQIDHDIVMVPRALYSSASHKHAVLGLDFRLAIEQVRLAASRLKVEQTHIPSPRRIYVTREGEKQRPMTNEPVVREFFERQGFFIFRASNLSLLEQAKQFSNASVVVGPHGAGLTNAAFSAPNTLVFEFRPLNRMNESPALESSYRKLAAIMGFRYGFLVVPNAVDSDSWSAPEEKMATIAKELSNA